MPANSDQPRRSLADRYKPAAKTATTVDSKSVLDQSMQTGLGEPRKKRLTLDLTESQHKKIKMRAIENGGSMADILRNLIDGI